MTKITKLGLVGLDYAGLVKYHWKPRQGIESLAAEIPGQGLGTPGGGVTVATKPQGGRIAYEVDVRGGNPYLNFEPPPAM